MELVILGLRPQFFWGSGVDRRLRGRQILKGIGVGSRFMLLGGWVGSRVAG